MYINQPKEKKPQTHSTQKNTESQLMVLTPWRSTTVWAGELQHPYEVSQLTDRSQLRENITGEPCRFWSPATWNGRNPRSRQDIGEISDPSVTIVKAVNSRTRSRTSTSGRSCWQKAGKSEHYDSWAVSLAERMLKQCHGSTLKHLPMRMNGDFFLVFFFFCKK